MSVKKKSKEVVKSKKSKAAPEPVIKKKKKAVEAEPAPVNKKKKMKREAKAEMVAPLATDMSGGKSKGKEVKTIDDLKGAKYNPRIITDKQLKGLQKSIETFGDLSGIVFNTNSGILVSGHQRVKTFKGKKTKIVKHKVKDKTGTVALGYVEVYEDGHAEPIKVPYREVNWNAKNTEIAANIAANMAGGNFDQVKLGGLMHALEKANFDIELTSIDKWDLNKAIGKHKRSAEGAADSSGSGKGTGDEFETIDPRAMQFEHQCPKCKFKF
jgi:hypothetical protein